MNSCFLFFFFGHELEICSLPVRFLFFFGHGLEIGTCIHVRLNVHTKRFCPYDKINFQIHCIGHETYIGQHFRKTIVNNFVQSIIKLNTRRRKHGITI